MHYGISNIVNSKTNKQIPSSFLGMKMGADIKVLYDEQNGTIM